MMNCKIQLIDYQITHAHIHTHIHREIVSSIINRGEYRRLGGFHWQSSNRGRVPLSTICLELIQRYSAEMESRIKLLGNGWSWVRMGFLSSRTLSTGQACNGCDLAELFVKSRRRNLSTRKPDHVPSFFSTTLLNRDDDSLLDEEFQIYLFFCGWVTILNARIRAALINILNLFRLMQP